MTKKNPAYFVSIQQTNRGEIPTQLKFCSPDVVSKFEGEIKISEINYIFLCFSSSAKTKH